MYSVTSAPTTASDDRNERLHRYLFSMGIRTLCFVLSVVFIAVLHWNIAGWILVGAAVILPYVAVVMANAAQTRRPGTFGAVTPASPPEQRLPSSPSGLDHGDWDHGDWDAPPETFGRSDR